MQYGCVCVCKVLPQFPLSEIGTDPPTCLTKGLRNWAGRLKKNSSYFSVTIPPLLRAPPVAVDMRSNWSLKSLQCSWELSLDAGADSDRSGLKPCLISVQSRTKTVIKWRFRFWQTQRDFFPCWLDVCCLVLSEVWLNSECVGQRFSNIYTCSLLLRCELCSLPTPLSYIGSSVTSVVYLPRPLATSV